MAKVRSKAVYVCQQCGGQSPQWKGRCPECGEWNSLVETIEREPSSNGNAGHSALASLIPPSEPMPLPKIAADNFRRMSVPIGEFNRVLGGGIVPGSVVLISGDPGIGKSTLLLQVSAMISDTLGKVLYVSGEESAQQIKMRAARLGIISENLYILSETNLNHILDQIEQTKPSLIVVDSIQTMYLDAISSAAGSVAQVRECAVSLLRVAKGSNIPVFLVGHVTKEGAIAGPRVLEHVVDTVLYLEGERFNTYRLLRGVKNRFGSTNEVGVFEMQNEGMLEVSNPSQAFLAERTIDAGSTVIVTLEGTRPLLVEVQALTSTTSFGLPRRTTTGIDNNRLVLLTAVLTKRVGLALSNQDIYVNVVGGLKISEPSADLGVAVAIASSFRDAPVDPELVVIGEVGLSGELRSVGQIEKRMIEAAKLGFKKCIIPKAVATGSRLGDTGLKIATASTVSEALDTALGR